MTKIAIDLVSGKLTNSKYSHKNAWAHLRACQLSNELNKQVEVLHNNEDWNNYDEIYLYHGMEFKGSLNLFGGATIENAKFYERIGTTSAKLISLDMPMPDYGFLCSSRKTADDYWKAIDWEAISKKCLEVKEYYLNPNTDKLIIGDSHSFSTFYSNAMVVRKDGRTLKGVLRKTIKKEIEDNNIDITQLNYITCYWGNIDIRHHILRNSDPKKEIDEILLEYERQLLDLNIQNIELVELLPIEDESRRIPKTGFFENTPFYGSQKERTIIMEYFNNKLKQLCEKNNWKLFTRTQEMFIITSIEYMNTYMERPKNVHLAPLYHRWDYWNNKPNIPEIKQFNKIVTF